LLIITSAKVEREEVNFPSVIFHLSFFHLVITAPHLTPTQTELGICNGKLQGIGDSASAFIKPLF